MCLQLQVNHSPSFNTDTPLDAQVKEALLKDTLTLLNLGACNRRQIVEAEKRMVQERLLQKRPMSSQCVLVCCSGHVLTHVTYTVVKKQIHSFIMFQNEFAVMCFISL